MKDNKVQSMKEIAAEAGNRLIPIHVGELFEVKIVQILKTRILVDVGGFSLGFIPEQEFSPDMVDLKVGDKILAYVLSLENDDGYVILSLKRADKERITKMLDEKYESGQVLQVKTTSANKGGLLCQFGEFEGFLPVSQLATSHYPKVASGDRDEIFNRLKSLVGQTFHVKILTFEPGAGKLIFSEKAAGDTVMQEKIKNIEVGKKLAGEITGVVNFGLFTKVKVSENEEMEGLVHISEASWEHIDDLTKHFEVGQKIDVEVISTDNNRLSLSIKRLQPDPWLKNAEGFEIGKSVLGTVTKITPFGAFVKVGSIDGLVHISELGEKITDAHEVVSEGKSYQFKVTAIEPELHKLSLSLKDNKKTEKPKVEKPKIEKPKKETKKSKKVKKGEA